MIEHNPRANAAALFPALLDLGEIGHAFFRTLAAGSRSIRRESERLVLLTELLSIGETRSAVDEVIRNAWDHMTQDEVIDERWLQQGVIAGDESMGENLSLWRGLHEYSQLPPHLARLSDREAATAAISDMADFLAGGVHNFHQARCEASYRVSASNRVSTKAGDVQGRLCNVGKKVHAVCVD